MATQQATPLMRQHQQMKAKYPDAILLFRVGDFYETFGQDAIDTSKILNITLTKRNNGSADSIELAGFPHHALDNYLHKLIKAGRRVAICDQLEDPKSTKNLVKRGITEIVTPGVTINDKILNAGENNYLACIVMGQNQWGIALVDVSTAQFYTAEGEIDFIKRLLFSFKPSEIILSKSKRNVFNEHIGEHFYTYGLDDWLFEWEYSKETLIKHFGAHHSLKGFGLQDHQEAVISAGVILHYLSETKHPNLSYLQNIQKIYREEYLWMDAFTFRSLEITTGAFPLIQILDDSKTPMGARMLKQWVSMPLINKKAIDERLSATEYFFTEGEVRDALSTLLQKMGDMERITNKISTRRVNPREVFHLANALSLWEEVRKIIAKSGNSYMQNLIEKRREVYQIISKIEQTLTDDPPLQIGKSTLIKYGINAELDELRNLLQDNQSSILSIQQQAILETGITALKVGFNNIHGYYLEVSHTHKQKVPSTWMRKQTLTNAERYITQELKNFEDKILNAQEKILDIEQKEFEQLLIFLDHHVGELLHISHAIACIDCLRSFGSIAVSYHYTKPEITEGETLELLNSRHPVIERHMLKPGDQYIANDIYLNQEKEQIIIITGPNMSGKSALLRQTALNTLLAHIGSFVACSSAKIPLTDRIFTRVGAQDNLAQGESTFMLEMNETASILNNLSKRSLVLLDEIGRGTATYDGISIAWGIIEFLSSHSCRPKTLFSTHYHELVAIEQSLHNVKNFHISHREENQKVIFLRKLVSGGSTHSFGIHVAQMAGIPPAILKRAKEILSQLEERETNGLSKKMWDIAQHSSAYQINISHSREDEKLENLRNVLMKVDINRMSPVEALLKIQELKECL